VSFIFKHKKYIFLTFSSVLLICFALCLPYPIFNKATSTILEDYKGNLLAARIADDGQWRFPTSENVPDKFKIAICYFEDEYFYYHPGVNPVSLIRAFYQNIKANKVISGGSTISMQTIRLSRNGKSRTLFEKAKEFFLALRMELTYSKNEILNMYASNAPFGGNIVGLETASWKYYGRSPDKLSWGEITSLAVLPNAPSLIYPGKNQDKLKLKRNKLLDKLYKAGEIDKFTCNLAKEEVLPNKTYPIPRIAPHLLDRVIKDGKKGQRVKSTLHKTIQETTNKVVDHYHNILSNNEIHNIAALIIEVESGKVISYTGNSNCPQKNSGKDVDIITSSRSSGSILKPFLYSFMLQDGEILPHTLIPDIPTQISGFSPKNFDKTYDGMVPAGEALARSLNIPAVRMLQNYGLEKFHYKLNKLNLSTINKSSNHYGLSLILGGAEVTLWDMCNEYLKMAQTLNNYNKINNSFYILQDSSKNINQKAIFQQGALWWTFEALSTLTRPWEEGAWKNFESSQKIAWKTGTSFGHRDAWAIGMTPKYIIGVWVGNADGEGRPGLTGSIAAAPILFKLFKNLDKSAWFKKPEWDLMNIKICNKSGYLASDICDNTRIIQAPLLAERTEICPYHKIIHLDKNKEYRVNSSCYPSYDIKTVPWFILPPVQEWYFKKNKPFYKKLPEYKSDCKEYTINNIGIVYPRQSTKIFIPKNLDGSTEKVIFEVVHRIPNSKIFWHLDSSYIGFSKGTHKMEINANTGKHIITLVDELGETIIWNFEIIDK
jgi:penicillin-binding protein 1C